VINTLTLADYFAIITFNDEAEVVNVSSPRHMIRASRENVELAMTAVRKCYIILPTVSKTYRARWKLLPLFAAGHCLKSS